MNLHGLRLFYTVARTGSITKAAQALHISQPAVSSQLKAFEAELNMPLLQKDGRGIVPTPFGKQLADKAETLFAVEAHIEAFVQEFRDVGAGHIHVAATYLPANFLLPQLAGAFKAQYPTIDLQIETVNSQQAFEKLARYKADVAMYAGSIDKRAKEFVWDEWLEDELWFVVAPSHRLAHQRVTLAEVVVEPFVMREEGSSTRAQLFALCQANQVKPPTIALQFSGLNEALSAVMAGFGVNFVSSLVANEHIKRGDLARVYVKHVHIVNNIAICTRKQEQQNELVQRFISHCKRTRFKHGK